MKAKDLLFKTRISNREIGRQRLRQQLRLSTDQQAAVTGYDAAAGRYTVTSLSGRMQTVESLTTAAFPVGRVVGITNGSIDAVPS